MHFFWGMNIGVPSIGQRCKTQSGYFPEPYAVVFAKEMGSVGIPQVPPLSASSTLCPIFANQLTPQK